MSKALPNLFIIIGVNSDIFLRVIDRFKNKNVELPTR
jgi:hypothetical protein